MDASVEDEDEYVLDAIPSTASDILGHAFEQLAAQDLQRQGLQLQAPTVATPSLPSLPQLLYPVAVDVDVQQAPMGAPQPAFGSALVAPPTLQSPFFMAAPAAPAVLGLQLPSGGGASGVHVQHGSGGSDASTDAAAAALAAACLAAPRQPHGGRAAAAPKRAAAGGSVAKLTNAEKLERERAKNRASQARYRARQKEIQQQLEQTYAQTADDLERERALHERLTTAQATMALMKDGKDALLEAAAQLSLADGPDDTLASFDEQQQLSQLEQQQQGGQQQQAGQQQQSGAAVAINTAAVEAAQLRLFALPLSERVGVCCAMFRKLEPAMQQLQQLSSEPDGFALETLAKQALVAQLVAANPLLREVIAAMTPEQLLQEWDEFGGHLAHILEQLDGGRLGEAEATERLHDAYLYNTILYTLLLMHNTAALRALLGHTQREGETPDAAAQRWKRTALDVAKISHSQAEKSVVGYRIYCQRMRQLNAESEAALATLRAAQQNLYAAAVSSLGPDSSLAASMKSYVALTEASGALSAASDGALLVLMDFIAVAGGVYTVLQRARFVADCRPLHPDAVVSVREASKHYGLDCGEADALAMQ